MSKVQIRRSVAGYDAPSDEAFERMFERDKETLRDLGVPVVTVTAAAHGDDQGYRIDPDGYALAPMELTAAQLGVLALAAELWQDQTLRTEAGRALTKLRVVGAEPADTVLGVVPRLHPAGPALGPLLDATTARQAVSFTYRAASTGQTRDRTVEPWRLVASRGGWYVVGHDRERDAARVFRLSRIVGRVRAVGDPGAFEAPNDVDARAMVEAAEDGEPQVAVLAVAPGRASALRARVGAAAPVGDAEGPPPAVPPGWDTLTVPFRRASDFADEITGYSDAVVVLAPASLRASVLRRLRETVAAGERLSVRQLQRGNVDG